MSIRILCFFTFLVILTIFFPATGQAGVEIQCPKNITEGQPFIARVVSDAPMSAVTLTWLGKSVSPEVVQDGETWRAEALLGIAMREKLKGTRFNLRAAVTTPDGVKKIKKLLTRVGKQYPEERLTVSKKFDSLNAKELKRYRRERKLINKALATNTPKRLWARPFVRPAVGAITSEYGIRRFFNKKPKSPHGGVDLDGEKGDPVVAASDGVVVLTGDFFFSGGSIFIDHGQGVVTMYFHLSKVDVQAGDVVKAGQLIGKIGSSGRVTGPHLHFGLKILGQTVDPMPMVDAALEPES